MLPSIVAADCVKCFWSARRFFDKDQPLFEILPDSYAELIFSFGSQCWIEVEERSLRLPNPFVIGLLDAPLYLHAEGSLQVLGVRLYPWSLAGFAQTYATGEFENWVPALKDAIDRGEASSALELLRRTFESRVVVSPALAVKKAGSLLLSRQGNATPVDLATYANATLRTLQRLFNRNCGQSAKSIARRMRFERVRDWIWNDPDVHLTRLAYECGFADQAHLNREFRHFTLKTPRQFARESRLSKGFLERNAAAILNSGTTGIVRWGE